MSNSPLTNPIFLKGAASFGLSIAVDRLYFLNSDLNSNLYFASAITGGIVLGQSLGKAIDFPSIVPNSESGLYSGKLVSQRAIELSTTVASGYLANKYLLKNEYNQELWIKKLISIGVIDVASEYISDYFLASPLDYFTD